MPLVNVRDTDIHYTSVGAGETVVLIHGLGSSGADWAFQLPALAPDYRVIVPDLRGSGLSAKPQGPYRIADFAADFWALLDALELTHAHLVGFSLGGAVALEMALQRPHAARKLVMINSLPTYRVDHWRKWMEVRVQIALVNTLGLKRTARMVAKRLFPHPHQAAMRDRVSDVVGANPRRAYLDTVRALVGWCALDRIAQLQSPVLMIAAEHDYTALDEKHALAARLGAQIVVVKGSRHGTPFDSIEACNTCVLAFLRDQPLPDNAHLRIDAPEQTPLAAPAAIERS